MRTISIEAKYLLIFLLCLMSMKSFSQSQRTESSREKEPEKVKNKTIVPDVRTWVLRDDFTYSDTVAVDTLSTGYQIYNPIFKRSIAQNNLGNMGLAYQSHIFSDRDRYYGFMFYNTVLAYMPQPEEFTFYNTKTPYVNLTYHFGGPKRLSEEFIQAKYTQNINKRLNVGVTYNLSSSIGQYQAQRADNHFIRFFTSYSGENYKLHASAGYDKVENYENGGVDVSQLEVNEEIDYGQPDIVPVHFLSAQNQIKNYRFFLNQSLNVGHIKKLDVDSVEYKIPVTSVFHTLEMSNSKRVYSIDNLEKYYQRDDPYYPNIYTDSIQTRDSTSLLRMQNTFQIKFNEEANSLLRFGLRAFITNDISRYFSPAQTTEYDVVNAVYMPHYKQQDSLLVTSAIGGQIFKNLGDNFWWNAGLKLYFQGYRAGDTELTGNLNSSFTLLNDTAGFFATGGVYLKSPEYFYNEYYSNHIKWSNDFDQQKLIKVHGGIRIPTKRFELSGGIDLLHDYIFFGLDAKPDQSNTVTQIYSAQIKQHFVLNKIHSNQQLVWQLSSNDNVIDLPTFSYFSSNYYQNVLFKVLHFQLGFDVRAISTYYAPRYMPATGQFYLQKDGKIGDYPFVDVFLNVLLKRARIYLKYDHVNQGFPPDGSLTGYGYPGNPRSLKFGVSWNFYD